MKSYPTYRPTGIAWLPQIPEHWNMFRGKRLFRVIDDRSQDGSEELLTVSHITGVTPRSQKNVTMFQSESLVGYKRCQVNDLAANTMWMWQGAIGVSKYAGVISPAYDVYRQREDFYNSRFLDFLLRTPKLIGQYHALSTGIQASRLRLYPDVFLTICFPLPPRDEQDQIVRFLDWKVARINKLINIKKNQIAILGELGKNIIYKTITHGLNENVTLKDSGIEWLGNIPKEWNIGKAKRFVNITNGTDPKTNGMIPVYGSGKIPFKTCGEFKNGPVVLLGRKGSIKTPNYVEGKYWNVDTAFDVKVISQKLLIKFYYYLAICFDYDSYITQTAIPSITQTDYENIYLPIPNTDEQVAIITYLDTKCATIDNAIVQKEKNIKVLNELKTRLISDVVTGKIDVRDIKVPEYEFIAEESLDEADASEDEMGSEVEEN